MQLFKTILTAGFFAITAFFANAQTGVVGHFKKVIVSPYIQATFVQGETESVKINDIIVDSSKLHVEMEDGALRLYLDGAKELPNDKHGYDNNGGKHSYPLYPNHAVTVTITYKTLEALSLRGEENHVCQSPITTDEFTLRVYGEAKVTFNEVHLGEMHATMYGESTLDIKAGTVTEQYYTCYGESKINATAITGRESKVTAYGEAQFNLNVTDRIKITAFGEAKLRYMGNPNISKGLHFGGLDVRKIY